ncbi:hypothetical protein O181_025158 [Austropuccinia psidii MF-1]|uniref:Uncharacterized protein n=1 Tax=Austropuccinia psidii MF-1 TaxID=1389203 RepID=A0A9Q3CM63_9BASI|nr:hypothetical protein [Austropuccinia psidii MF-1]
MPSTRSGARYNPSSSSEKGYRCDYGRSQSVKEGKGSVNESQTDKLFHYDADNTVSPPNRADNATRSLSGHIQSQPQGLKHCIAAQRVPDPSISVEKLHELLPNCEKISGPSQHFQVTQWMASIVGKEKYYAFYRRIEENNPPPPKQVPKTAPVASSSNSNVKKQPQAQSKGKGKAPATKTYIQGYRIPKIRQDAMENVLQIARTMMELKKKRKPD